MASTLDSARIPLPGTFGLADHTIAAISGVFASQPAIIRAIVYGSRAKGNYHPGSDIDIVLEAPTFGLTELFRVENAIDDLMLPYKIDLSLLHQIDNAALLAHIDRVGKPIWVKTSG